MLLSWSLFFALIHLTHDLDDAGGPIFESNTNIFYRLTRLLAVVLDTRSLLLILHTFGVGFSVLHTGCSKNHSRL